MNNDLFEFHWQEIKNRIQASWDQLSEADLDKVGGDANQFSTLLQQKYGYTKERAEDELSHLVDTVNIR